MRRFSRKRRSSGGGGRSSRPIDSEKWLGALRESSFTPSVEFSVLSHADVPPDYALVARGETESGGPIILSFSPDDAGSALLGGLVTGARLAEEESFSGEVLVVAPSWSIRARRRLALVKGELPFKVRALAAPGLSASGHDDIVPEADLEPAAVAISALAAQLPEAQNRALFLRAAKGLEGLAAKHGGATRAFSKQVELVVNARRMAELRLDERDLVLTTWGQQKATRRLTSDLLANALDELEGQVRRRINDRKVREGEEGLRARAIPLVVEGAGLRDTASWPLGGGDEEQLDVVGLRQDGRPAAAGIRSNFDLKALGLFLDGLQQLRLAQDALFAGADAPVLLGDPGLLIVASEYSSGALRALSALALAQDIFRLEEDRDKGLFLTPIAAEEAARSLKEVRERRATRSRRGGRRKAESRERASGTQDPSPTDVESPDAGQDEASETPTSSRNRNRRSSRKRGRGKPREEDSSTSVESGGAGGFDEVSMFELGEPDEEEGTQSRRRRSRRKGKGREGASPVTELASSTETDEPAAGKSPTSEDDADDFTEETIEGLAELPTGLAEGQDAAASTYEEDEDETQSEDAVANTQAAVSEPAGESAESAATAEVAPKPRRRAVIVAAADRDAVGAAVLLARDVRLLEGIWIYPQSDLMHFFREVTTDLRDDVPIHIVGFTPSPAIDVLQAVSLYRDRIDWYDHHDWPPEDLFALEQAIGADAIHYSPGVGSSLPAILEGGTRRSRFSDKLVDLMRSRFTQHDYERWGRLWWWRLGEIATRTGDVRREIDPLLAGRPSDLAREASQVAPPPIPAEVEWVSQRDFRLVHFAGYVMAVVETDPEIDTHLASRIVRERYGAQLSLARQKEEELFLLTGDDSTARRSLDFAGLAQHLEEKLDWVTSVGAQDHVARIRIAEISDHPDRLQEVIAEIAMGRSVLER